MVMNEANKTIVALATPVGRGAIAIVRLSGKDAHALLRRAFRPFGRSELRHGELTLGAVAADGITDKAMAVIFHAPKSYTGEDTAEVHCHGSPEIAARIVRGFIALGALPAEPGEFTKRAFLNGKLTLDEAEAVGDLVNAQTREQINAAYAAVRGGLNAAVTAIYDALLGVTASFEAAIDYPEEDVEELTADAARQTLSEARGSLAALVASYGAGEKVRGGVRVAIVGVPNAGKSSLLNRLLGRERAIVTAQAGTTRDTVEESYEYKGMLFTLVDTAGLREAADEAERAGVERSAAAARTAHVVLRVTDLAAPAAVNVKTSGAVIDVYNKTDLAPAPCGALAVSAKTGDGIDALKEAIYAAAACGDIVTGGAMLTGARHYALALDALEALDACLADLGVVSVDCLLVGLRAALDSLGRITGATATDDVINEIFSKFCVGK